MNTDAPKIRYLRCGRFAAQKRPPNSLKRSNHDRLQTMPQVMGRRVPRRV